MAETMVWGLGLCSVCIYLSVQRHIQPLNSKSRKRSQPDTRRSNHGAGTAPALHSYRPASSGDLGLGLSEHQTTEPRGDIIYGQEQRSP
ncbi:hypothetical protein K437DRAFT_44967 [Tilletiaria anomala UBC 951]|uniref:Uncharacterized protein n=1 Tax=Tilletiaria anomala (strain ATCC 24038 / CBS 436.72 / UBC 951) TaxID=1037660 RepID=A0A066WE08_TILAU|nr:uncharacterized protein K437DRAFT_44967 [Tilletiaria anomala UBC 951]KDN51986.1 hypothetical protein K437DRAFT_44967 [Tilletiaria anomala UBC 951]